MYESPLIYRSLIYFLARLRNMRVISIHVTGRGICTSHPWLMLLPPEIRVKHRTQVVRILQRLRCTGLVLSLVLLGVLGIVRDNDVEVIKFL